MLFLQATRAPAIVRLGNLKLVVPKFEMSDVVDWGVELAEKQNAMNTQDMDEQRKAEWISYYGKMSMDFEEVKRLLRTPLGVERVFKVTMAKAKVFRVSPQKKGTQEKEEPLPQLTQEQVEKLYKVNGPGRLAGFAWVVADVDDSSALKDPTEKGEDGEDPLALLEKVDLSS